MSTDRSLDTLIDALGLVLAAAPARERRLLAGAIEEYANRRPTAFRDLRNGHPAGNVRALIAEMIAAVDADPDISD